MKVEDLAAVVETLSGTVASLAEAITEIQGQLNGWLGEEDEDLSEETPEQRATRVGLVNRVDELEALVRGRNSSAPVKRNMTDNDARECLTGSVADKDHKTAAEEIGLTYAQIYSCRLEYTFKHVHKELRESGWKNPWSKK